MIKENKNIVHRPVSIKHPDITAIIYYLERKKRRIILVSKYILYIRIQQEKNLQQLKTQLSIIKQVYIIEKSIDVDLDLIFTSWSN